MMQFIPAFSIIFLIIAVMAMIFLKFRDELLAEVFKNTNQVVLISLFAIALVCILHLFSSQSWTPDLLKVLAGVLVGAASAGTAGNLFDAAKKVEAAGATFGDNAKLAAGDINEISNRINSMKGDISSIKDSVINQTAGSAYLDKNKVHEYLFTTHFYDKAEPLEIIAKESKQISEQGWQFRTVSPGYGYSGDKGGVLVVYTRSRDPESNDIKLAGGGYMTRFYHGDDISELGI